MSFSVIEIFAAENVKCLVCSRKNGGSAVYHDISKLEGSARTAYAKAVLAENPELQEKINARIKEAIAASRAAAAPKKAENPAENTAE